MYDSFESLPDEIQRLIRTLIAPPDPEAWVRSPVQALDDRSFLDVMNSDGGDEAAAKYFDRVEAFERPGTSSGSENLGQALHFDEADLDSNRAGLLSASQRKRLVRGDVWIMLGGTICLVAGVVFNIALLAGWITAHGRGAAAGVALMLLGIVLAVWSAETWLDLRNGSVLVMDGYLRPTERIAIGRYGASTVYCLEVGGQTFDVSKAAHDEIREGQRRLYYLRHTRAVLSVDQIHDQAGFTSDRTRPPEGYGLILD